MRRTMVVTGLCALIWVGCSTTERSGSSLPVVDGNDATDGTDGTEGTEGTGGTDGTDDAGTDGTVSSDAGDPSMWNIPAGEDVVCEHPKAKPPQGDETWPFTGLSTTPHTEARQGVTFDFDCTMCPGGTNGISGRYRYYLGDRPDQPSTDEWRETIEFRGNAFINVLEGPDVGNDNKWTKAVAKGYYFCPEPSALQAIKYTDYWNAVFVYTSIEPEGAFGITTGTVDPCFLGVSSSSGTGANDVRIECNIEWDPNGPSQIVSHYCRVNSSLFGVPCKDPFAD